MEVLKQLINLTKFGVIGYGLLRVTLADKYTQRQLDSTTSIREVAEMTLHNATHLLEELQEANLAQKFEIFTQDPFSSNSNPDIEETRKRLEVTRQKLKKQHAARGK